MEANVIFTNLINNIMHRYANDIRYFEIVTEHNEMLVTIRGNREKQTFILGYDD